MKDQLHLDFLDQWLEHYSRVRDRYPRTGSARRRRKRYVKPKDVLKGGVEDAL